MPINNLQTASKTLLTIFKKLATAPILQVPRTDLYIYASLQPALNYLMRIKSLQTSSIHKCQNLANRCQFTNIKTLQTVANSQMTNQSLPLPKPKLTNCFNSQVPRTCRLMSTHKCQTKASKQLQSTSTKTLQTVENKRVPNQALPMPMINQSLQNASIHKCQELAS